MALPELLSAPGAAPALPRLFPRLFRNLLLLLGGAAMTGARERSALLRALRSSLSLSGCDALELSLDGAGGWDPLGGGQEGIGVLAGAMAQFCAPRLPPIVRSLLPVLEIQRIPGAAESQRITAAAFLAELLAHRSLSELALPEPLLEALLAALERDPSPRVRALALRGLGNAADAAPEQIRRLGPRLLPAILAAMDDKDDSEDRLALAAMAALSGILERLEEREARPALLHVAIRIRPFFDSDRPDLRRSSLLLLAALSRGAAAAAASPALSEPLLGALVPLLLHLRDPDPAVAQASSAALRAAGPGLGCSELQELLGKRLRDQRGLHYGEFLNRACRSLLGARPSLLPRLLSTDLFYCRSPWAELRAAAALLAGFLVLHVDEERGRELDLDQLIAALQPLLQDPDPSVRLNAAETLGRLVRLL